MNVSIVLKLFDGVTAPIRRVSQAIDQASKAMEKTRERADKAFERADRIKQAADNMLRFSRVMTDEIQKVVEAASDFEQAMLGVAKQVDGARDASGALTPVYRDMAKQIQLLGRDVPMATNKLAEMAAAGARMGIAKNDLIAFTKTTAMMAEAFEVTDVGGLAEDMGKISVLFKLTQPEVQKLADSINYLDDNAISKGSGIIDFLKRVGGLAGTVKISEKNMAALGSTLLTLGEEAFPAGRAVNAIMSSFAAATKGAKPFRAAMYELGLSLTDVQKGMQVDAQGTLLKVLEAVNKLPSDKRIGVLTQLVGIEHSDTLAKLAVGIAEYRKQIDLANSQKAEGSMSREFQARLATTAAQWEILKNRALELAVNVGEVLLPEINKLIDKLKPLTSGLADWAKEHPTLTEVITLTAVAVAALTTALAGLMVIISAMLGVYGVFMLAKAFGIFALVLRASMLPAIWSMITALPAFVAGLWTLVAPTLAAAAPFLVIAAAILAVSAALLQLIRLAREWDQLDFGEVWKGFHTALGDGSFWKTVTLNPFSGLNDVENGRSGGLQPVALGPPMSSATGAGPLGASEAPAGTLVVKFDENNQPVVKSMEAKGFNLEAEANTGRMMSY